MKYQKHSMVILLGSNIDPENNLPRAVQLLNSRFQIDQLSSAWETPAVGSDGPDFLNAAVLLESHLSPRVMKEFVLRPLEASLGRVRTYDKNAPRTIDLDVVVSGVRTWDNDIWQYAHAAVPVAELVPELRSEAHQETLAQVAQKLQRESEIHPRADVFRQGGLQANNLYPVNIAEKIWDTEFIHLQG